MKTDQFLAISENREAVREISLQTVAELAPSEVRMSRKFIDPLLDMTAKEESLTVESGDASLGLGGAELALMVIVPTVVTILTQYLAKLGEERLEAVKSRVQEKDIGESFNIHIVDSISEKYVLENVDLAKLRWILTEYFSEGELRNLCFDLDVDHEDLPVESKEDLAREMIDYFRRRRRLAELTRAVLQERPQISRSEISKTSADDRSDPEGTPTTRVEITREDIEGFVIDTKYTKDKKKIDDLVHAIEIVLQKHLEKYYE